MRKIRWRKKSKLVRALQNSPINYFSDLFIVAMVLSWMVVLVIMTCAAVYSTISFHDNSIWSEVGTLVAVPLSAGGAIWMIKNSVQHAIANSKGKKAKADFPDVFESSEGEMFEEI